MGYVAAHGRYFREIAPVVLRHEILLYHGSSVLFEFMPAAVVLLFYGFLRPSVLRVVGRWACLKRSARAGPAVASGLSLLGALIVWGVITSVASRSSAAFASQAVSVFVGLVLAQILWNIVTKPLPFTNRHLSVAFAVMFGALFVLAGVFMISAANTQGLPEVLVQVHQSIPSLEAYQEAPQVYRLSLIGPGYDCCYFMDSENHVVQLSNDTLVSVIRTKPIQTR